MSDRVGVGGPPPAGLTLGARQLLERAAADVRTTGSPYRRWLATLLERNGPLVRSMVPDLDIPALLADLSAMPPTGPEEIRDEVELRSRASAHAAARGRGAVSEIDLAAVLLAAAGRAVPAPNELGRLRRASAGRASSPDGSGPASGAAPGQVGETPRAAGALPTSGQADTVPRIPIEWHPRATAATPTLDRYGRDLTRQAAEGRLGPVVGRERECEMVIETLCRRQKRNPVLLGAAGTGKTAIVEGLARRIVAGTVAPALRGVRIVQLQPSSLVAGAGVVGELENRMKAILEEARQDGIILFFDEVHAIVGTGGMRGTGDLASLLKPALARGEIACIAATTDDEYRRFIEDDAALERRFNPVPVAELDRASTLAVLQAHRDELGRLRGVRVSDELLEWILGFAIDALPNRRLPDKAVDLLEQCVAHAVVQGATSIERVTAEEVVQRMVGVPQSISERLANLERELAARGLSNPAATRVLIDRLAVTMRGFDSRRDHPNAVVLVTGDAAGRARDLAETLATTLFGGADRVVEIDLGRMTTAYDVAMLVGAPPGYIGYSDRLPIHRIAAMPWSVVLCEGVDAAHAEVRGQLTAALEDGAFVDGAGRRIALSDTIVLLVLGATEVSRPVGFRIAGSAETHPVEAAGDALRAAPHVLGERLARLVDAVIETGAAAAAGPAGTARILARLADRFAQEGTTLVWEPSVGPWLASRASRIGDLDVVADRELLPRLVPILGLPDRRVRRIRVSVGPSGDIVTMEEPESTEPGDPERVTTDQASLDPAGAPGPAPSPEPSGPPPGS